MKYSALKILSMCLLFALVVGACMPGFAEDDKPALITGSGILWVGLGRCPVVAINLPANAKSFSVTSSKPGVLKVGKQKGFGPYGWWMEPLKPGKAKITLKYKTGGKIKSVSATFQVKNYPDPFEYIKINGKKVDLKKNKFEFYSRNYKKKTFTVSFKLNAGWKLDSNPCPGAYWIGDDFGDGIKWKNGKSFKLPAEYDRLCAAIDIVNKNTGDFFNYEIWFTK